LNPFSYMDFDQVDKIRGILLHCVGSDPTKVGAAA
jgi:hypothetical protein